MDENKHRFLVRVAVILTVAWVGWTFYDSYFTSVDPYANKLSSADRFFEDGRYAKALDVCDEILDRDPENIDALGRKAQALLLLGRNEEALTLYDDLIEGNPEIGLTYTQRGILKDRLGDYEGALVDYERSLALTPSVAEGPGIMTRFLRNQAEKPATIADRARYLREQLAKPAQERLLSLPEEDARQRPYKL